MSERAIQEVLDLFDKKLTEITEKADQKIKTLSRIAYGCLGLFVAALVIIGVSKNRLDTIEENQFNMLPRSEFASKMKIHELESEKELTRKTDAIINYLLTNDKSYLKRAQNID